MALNITAAAPSGSPAQLGWLLQRAVADTLLTSAINVKVTSISVAPSASTSGLLVPCRWVWVGGWVGG